MLELDKLIEIAKNYKYDNLPISYNADHYTRTPIFKNDELEIVVICFSPGQSSSIHDHQGSNCVVSLVQGRLLENFFEKEGDYLNFQGNHYLFPGDTSGLDPTSIHQICNLSCTGSVLLNFYSPPFSTTKTP